MKLIAKYEGSDHETQVVEYQENDAIPLEPPSGDGWRITHTDSKSSGLLRVTWTRETKKKTTILYD